MPEVEAGAHPEATKNHTNDEPATPEAEAEVPKEKPPEKGKPIYKFLQTL